MKRRLNTFLNLETMVSMQIQPIIAHVKERSERNLQKEEISLGNLHTHNFPHLNDEMAHYDNNSFGKVSNSHPEPIQYSDLCCPFLALLKSNEFPNTNGHPMF
jgi:hypothetical protein